MRRRSCYTSRLIACPPAPLQSGLWCPIHHAADSGHADVICLLLSDPRVDVNVADKVGQEARYRCFLLVRHLLGTSPCTCRMAKLHWTGPLARPRIGAAEDGKRLPLRSKQIRA